MSAPFALEVLMSWGDSLLAHELVTEPRTLTLGRGPEATFPMPEQLAEEGFEFVSFGGGAWRLRLPTDASVEAFVVDGVCRRSYLADVDREARRLLPIGPTTRALVNGGPFAFSVRGTTPTERAPRGGNGDSVASYIGASFAFHAFMVFLMFLAPPRLTHGPDAEHARILQAALSDLSRHLLVTTLAQPSREGTPGAPAEKPTASDAPQPQHRNEAAARVRGRGSHRPTRVDRLPSAPARPMPECSRRLLLVRRIRSSTPSC
ncbi:MAG: hypothetical protein GW913_03010 [Myxococcales bacterium]|nr:hypothetical protein [Myxococcales bacterium]